MSKIECVLGTWMSQNASRDQRLADIETCRECSGALKVIACIEDPVVIQKILDHLKDKAETTAHTPLLLKSRAPPAGLFG